MGMYRRRRWPEDRLFAPETESENGSSVTSTGEWAREEKQDTGKNINS